MRIVRNKQQWTRKNYVYNLITRGHGDTVLWNKEASETKQRSYRHHANWHIKDQANNRRDKLNQWSEGHMHCTLTKNVRMTESRDSGIYVLIGICLSTDNTCLKSRQKSIFTYIYIYIAYYTGILVYTRAFVMGVWSEFRIYLITIDFQSERSFFHWALKTVFPVLGHLLGILLLWVKNRSSFHFTMKHPLLNQRNLF